MDVFLTIDAMVIIDDILFEHLFLFFIIAMPIGSRVTRIGDLYEFLLILHDLFTFIQINYKINKYTN